MSFGARISPLTGSPRLSVNPPNAMLNYLYAVLESEARLAAAALGLDPGLGVLHVDFISNRDSLALDLLEPVRPQVDSYLLEWITRQPLKRQWFFETGNCRLMVHLRSGSLRRLPCGNGLLHRSPSGSRKHYGTRIRDHREQSRHYQLASRIGGEAKDEETTSECKTSLRLVSRRSVKSVVRRESRTATAAHCRRRIARNNGAGCAARPRKA